MKVKNRILTMLVCVSLLISVINAFQINLIPKVEAQNGPITLINNPYLNDTNYWTPELVHSPAPESYVIMNSSGAYAYIAKGLSDFASWAQPWGMGHFYQGLRFHNGENYDIGKGLKHYIYIPADIPDGTIIANVTVERLMNPEYYNPNAVAPNGPEDFNFFTAPGSCTHFGVGFWYAVRVKFWDDPRVPEHLRNEETYLGWMSPEVHGAPNLFVQELFCDWRLDPWFDLETGFKVYARQYGNETTGLPIRWDAFLGSTEDWDWHSNFAMNATPLNQEITFTYDIGKAVKEFLNVFKDRPYLYGGNWDPRLLLQFGLFRAEGGIPNAAMGTLQQQLYDIVGVTLIGAAPTMEVVNAKMKAHFTWFQIYDYRGGDSWVFEDGMCKDCIDTWLWMKSKGLNDPFQEHWENAITSTQWQCWYYFRYSIKGIELKPDTSEIVLEGQYPEGEYSGYAFNLSAGNVWARAGVKYWYWENGTLNLPSQATTVTINVLFGVQYKGGMEASFSNAGVYLDYWWGTADEITEQGEVILFDYPEWHITYNNLTFYNATLKFEKSQSSANNPYVLILMPHVEAWYSVIWVRGFMDVGLKDQVNEPIKYTLTVDVNNPSYGTVTPSGTTEYFAMSNVTLTATPTSGYYFNYWHVQNTMHDIDVNYTNNPLTLHMNMDYNVTAYFSDTPYSPPNVTLTLSRQFILPSDVPSPYRIWGDIPPYPMICHNGNCGEGSWEYSVGSTISLQTTEPQGYKWLGWYNLTKEMYYTFTIEKDCIAIASWMPPLIKIIVKDACSFQPVSDFIVTVYKSGQEDYYCIHQSEFIFIGEPRSYKITISKLGAYYAKTVYVTPDAYGSPLEVFLNPVTFSGGSGGGGGGGLHYVRSKKFMFKFTVLNASSTEYVIWNNMVKVTPIAGATATLTLRVHYTTTYPIIEVYAENIAMVKFNWTDIYHSLNCPYFDRVSTLTRFYGVSINTTDPIILDMGLPAKPKELWKLTPDQELPGTLLTDWQWNNGRVLLQIIPGDPTVSMLLQSALERARDIPFEFLPLIVTLVMLLVLFKFIKDKL